MTLATSDGGHLAIIHFVQPMEIHLCNAGGIALMCLRTSHM